jgi:hypothetical protein
MSVTKRDHASALIVKAILIVIHLNMRTDAMTASVEPRHEGVGVATRQFLKMQLRE